MNRRNDSKEHAVSSLGSVDAPPDSKGQMKLITPSSETIRACVSGPKIRVKIRLIQSSFLLCSHGPKRSSRTVQTHEASIENGHTGQSPTAGPRGPSR